MLMSHDAHQLIRKKMSSKLDAHSVGTLRIGSPNNQSTINRVRETPNTIKESNKRSSGTGAVLESVMVMKQPHGIELQTQDGIISGHEIEESILSLQQTREKQNMIESEVKDLYLSKANQDDGAKKQLKALLR